MQFAKSLSPLLLVPLLAPLALIPAIGQSVKVAKGIVTKIENVETRTDDHTTGGAVAGGVVGYNVGSGRSQTEKRRGAIVGAGIGAAAGSPKNVPALRYTIAVADGSTMAVVVVDGPTIEMGSCVSAEQSADRGTIREIDQAVCDLEAQTAVPAKPAQPANTAADPGNADKCQVAQQQLLDAKTSEEVNVASSKVEVLCE